MWKTKLTVFLYQCRGWFFFLANNRYCNPTNPRGTPCTRVYANTRAYLSRTTYAHPTIATEWKRVVQRCFDTAMIITIFRFHASDLITRARTRFCTYSRGVSAFIRSRFWVFGSTECVYCVKQSPDRLSTVNRRDTRACSVTIILCRWQRSRPVAADLDGNRVCFCIFVLFRYYRH